MSFSLSTFLPADLVPRVAVLVHCCLEEHSERMIPDKSSLFQRHVKQSLFDCHTSCTVFEKFATSHTENGFKRFWFSVSDDSKHQVGQACADDLFSGG